MVLARLCLPFPCLHQWFLYFHLQRYPHRLHLDASLLALWRWPLRLTLPLFVPRRFLSRYDVFRPLRTPPLFFILLSSPCIFLSRSANASLPLLLEKVRTQCIGTEGDARHFAEHPCLGCDLLANDKYLFVSLLALRLNIATQQIVGASKVSGHVQLYSAISREGIQTLVFIFFRRTNMSSGPYLLYREVSPSSNMYISCFFTPRAVKSKGDEVFTGDEYLFTSSTSAITIYKVHRGESVDEVHLIQAFHSTLYGKVQDVKTFRPPPHGCVQEELLVLSLDSGKFCLLRYDVDTTTLDPVNVYNSQENALGTGAVVKGDTHGRLQFGGTGLEPPVIVSDEDFLGCSVIYGRQLFLFPLQTRSGPPKEMAGANKEGVGQTRLARTGAFPFYMIYRTLYTCTARSLMCVFCKDMANLLWQCFKRFNRCL